jgi:uncharacterized protein (DUF1800 family)
MNRTEFFSSFIPRVDTPQVDASRVDTLQVASLSPLDKKLTQQQALHLLRRTTFATSWEVVKQFTGKTANEAVDLLLNNALKNPKPTTPSWIDKSYKAWWRLPKAEQQAATDAVYKDVYELNYELKRWWVDEMAKDTVSIREKMTLFWHGHFTTKFAIDQVMPAQLMHRQNDLFRTLHQGNFRELVEKVIVDGAMLIYLNGQDSTKKSPNENFSRELLELYTIGIGNYTEKDVQEGARALTGWRTNIFSDEWTSFGVYKTFFLSYEHDTTTKTYLGETIPPASDNTEAGIYKTEIKGLVDIIIRKRAEALSMFICEKLYRYFVYSNAQKVNTDIVKEMAQTFRDNNFEIRPVLAKLLKSAFFFEDANVGVQLKTPSELIVGITKHFDVKGDWKEWVMVTLGQELLNPPNVAGWVGYRKWSDTRTFPFAVQQIGYFIWNQKDDYMHTWIQQFDNYDDAKKLTQQICTLFLAKAPSATQLDRFVKNLLGGSPDYEWYTMAKIPGTASARVKYMLSQLIKSPDFHLT